MMPLNAAERRALVRMCKVERARVDFAILRTQEKHPEKNAELRTRRAILLDCIAKLEGRRAPGLDRSIAP